MCACVFDHPKRLMLGQVAEVDHKVFALFGAERYSTVIFLRGGRAGRKSGPRSVRTIHRDLSSLGLFVQ